MMPSSCCGKVHTGAEKFPARILIVDDEPLIRWSLCAGLRSAGFEAVSASSSADALDLAREYPRPDAVLLDPRLYDADPRVLLAELRRLAPHCQFLLLATAGQEMPALPHETVTIVEKPFDLADVVRLVDKTLATPTSA